MKLVWSVSLLLVVAMILGWWSLRGTPGCSLEDPRHSSFYITYERLEPPQGEPKSAILRLHNNTSCAVSLSGDVTDDADNDLKSGTIVDGDFTASLDRYRGVQITHEHIAPFPLPAAPPPDTPRAIDRMLRSLVLPGAQSLLFDVAFEDLRERRGIVLTPVFLWEMTYDETNYKDFDGTFHVVYFRYQDFPASVQAAIGSNADSSTAGSSTASSSTDRDD